MLPQMNSEKKTDVNNSMHQFIKGQCYSSHYNQLEKEDFKLPNAVFSNGYEPNSESKPTSKKCAQIMRKGSRTDKPKELN